MRRIGESETRCVCQHLLIHVRDFVFHFLLLREEEIDVQSVLPIRWPHFPSSAVRVNLWRTAEHPDTGDSADSGDEFQGCHILCTGMVFQQHDPSPGLGPGPRAWAGPHPGPGPGPGAGPGGQAWA